MKKAVLTNRILLTKTDELMDDLISELTYTFQPAKPKAKPERLCLVTGINANIISIPAGRLDLIPDDYAIIDKRILAPVTFPKAKISLRPSQQEIYDKIDDNWIINAKPGWGEQFCPLIK